MKLVLASASPRRRQILENAGYQVEVRVSQADESLPDGISPAQAVEYLAKTKAHAVKREANEVLVAADTVVVLDGIILGKPADEADAKRMLLALSGRRHEVYTGVCLLYNEKEEVFSERTEVEFFPLHENQISEYIKTGEPMDKAGAYGIQGRGCLFVKGITGDYYNVMGLPVSSLYRKIEKICSK